MNRKNIKKIMGKKGFYFTLDAILSATLLITGLILISQYVVQKSQTEQIDYLSKDLLAALSEIKIYEINESNPLVASEISNGNITEQNVSVLVQIGTYWALNEPDKANNLTELMTRDLISDMYGYGIWINNEQIYINNNSRQKDLISSRRMVSGVERGKPMQGSTSTAYLRKIHNKKTASYVYFGGFVGQGNLSVFMTDIPSDVTPAKITNITMELDADAQFNLIINGNTCGTFNPTTLNMTPNIWDITNCNTSIATGSNNFTIKFAGLLNTSYIAGGFIRVSYTTNEFQSNISYGTKRYYFPYIIGIINLYDAFYVPGTINSMGIYLKYFNTGATYLTIGNTEVFSSSGNNTTQVHYVDNANLTSFPILLNYNQLSNTTVPLRMSSVNITTNVTTQGGIADVVLITDLSGSMKNRIGYWDAPPYGNNRNCDNPDLYHLNDTRRVAIAKCVDKDFIDVVMNYTGNRIWLVDFSEDAEWYYNSDSDNLKNHVDGYSNNPDGGTCIACSINLAYNLLSNYSNSSRNKYIVVMTDGIPTYCTGTYKSGGQWRCNTTSTGITNQFNPSGCDGWSPDCAGNDCVGPMSNSIHASGRAHNLSNATVYSVGMGPIDTCDNANTTLLQIANLGNGKYYASRNASELHDFYIEIAGEIVAASQSSQLIIIKGNYTSAILDPSSYIEINYTPFFPNIMPNEISLVFQTNKFTNCTENVNIYPQLRVIDAKATSYSGIHWQDLLIANNNVVYNLSTYGSFYPKLGDPFLVQVPANLLTTSNTIFIETGDNPTNRTGCSFNNSMIYTALVNSSTARSDVVSQAIGCNWYIQFEDNTTLNASIPTAYNGTNKCNYTNTSIVYKNYDAYDVSVYSLLRQLDFDINGKVDINLNAADLEIIVTVLEKVPYMWGPAIVEARIWK